ncbi:MAG: helix-turn-helix domain-containing protein [Planctomycetota bacterium]
MAVARGHRVPAVARTLGVAERALRNWVHRYNERGLAGLADQRSGRKPRLSAKQIDELRKRMRAVPREDDGVCSLRGCDIRRILREEFHVRYARSSVYYLLHHQPRMGYLKPRPLHRKTDPVAQETFKKTFRKGSK